MSVQIIATAEAFDDSRFIVLRDCINGRGITIIREERRQRRGDDWFAVREIRVPNAALFVLHDAIGTACTLAAKDRR